LAKDYLKVDCDWTNHNTPEGLRCDNCKSHCFLKICIFFKKNHFKIKIRYFSIIYKTKMSTLLKVKYPKICLVFYWFLFVAFFFFLKKLNLFSVSKLLGGACSQDYTGSDTVDQEEYCESDNKVSS
jgi:hypothetical protein